ncbi:MAG: uracil-DNA glycosylase [Actinomycetota bacterium]|nr:uracil-DNA glycosylase [Actinomycetota bacterium]
MYDTAGRMRDLNAEVEMCARCRLCMTRENSLRGEGDLEARLLLVAQAPGKKEDLEGRMFIGPSGKVVDELLGEAGVERGKLYMTNLVKCMLPKYRRPREDEIAACSPYLEREIALVNPATVVPLGFFATRYILDRYGVPRPEARSEFSSVFGELVLAEGTRIYPLPHPAALLYDESRREGMKDVYGKLGVLAGECKWFPVCPLKRNHERGLVDREWIEMYCKGDWEACVRYGMEERGEPLSDYMLPDGSMQRV